jgi:hypothetical protein
MMVLCEVKDKVMARQKKPARTSTHDPGASPPARPAFPLNIDHARIFALAAEADAADAEAMPLPPPPQPTNAEDPFKALWEELRRLRSEIAPAAPPSATSGRTLVQMIREEIVAVLPELIREVVGQAAPQMIAPSAPSTVEQTKAWIAEELRTLEGGLSAVEPTDFLNDNRKLADRLFLEGAKTGRLFGVNPKEFFALLAGEISDFVFRIANKQVSSSTTRPEENTPASLETLRTRLQEIAVQPPLDTCASGFLPTPLLAARHPRDLARFGVILTKLKNQSKTAAAYYRLRTFAGRSDDEIAALTGEPKKIITERLGDFMELLEEDMAATDH